MMRFILSKFFKEQSGAVTVDWVVLTAGVVGFAAVGFVALENNSLTLMSAAGNAVGAENDF